MNVKEFNLTQLNTELICKQLLKNSIHNAVFIIDTQGIILGISQGVEFIYGYIQDDLIGKHFECLFTEEDRNLHKPELELATVLKNGSAADHNNILHKDGRSIWTEGESLLMTDIWGDSFIIKNAHSLQKQKEVETDLQQRNEKLLRINNDLDTFVHTVSHDLKNPVKNIEALISIVKTELEEGASATSMEPMITRITQALDRFKTTLDDLAVIGNVDTLTDSNDSYIQFDDVLHDVMLDLNDIVYGAEATIHTDFSVVSGIHFSKKNLRSIIYNLLSNALKYKSSDRKPEISICSNIENGYVLLSVRDNGIGIEPSQHKKVFEFFKRIHTHVEGSGVGMGIVKKIMDNADGKVTLESSANQGSVFTIHFKV